MKKMMILTMMVTIATHVAAMSYNEVKAEALFFLHASSYCPPYASSIAPTGQLDIASAALSSALSGTSASIATETPASFIENTSGQIPAHRPQPMHPSFTKYFIAIILIFFFIYYSSVSNNAILKRLVALTE